MKTVDDMLKYSSTAAGVAVMMFEAIGSPPAAIANEIGPTVWPVGTAMFPLKDTRNLARHC